MEQTSDEKAIREIRINPIIPSESVLVATARSMRPRKKEEPAPRDTRRHVPECAFCRGNEAQTPPEILRVPAASDAWDVRIVENLYPVLGNERTQPGLVFGLQQAIDGYGRHEVIVDHPQHGIAIREASPPALSWVRAYSSIPLARKKRRNDYVQWSCKCGIR
jgi:UDPglucose--hexose-1-phosphate uridylyltransferase